jgi:hypothetical protein
MYIPFLKYFKKPAKKSIHQFDAGPTEVDIYKMTLDERKEWRMQMLRKSVQDTLSSLEIISGMYRYRVTALDDRAHYYVVMMETTKHFAISKYASSSSLRMIEDLIRERTFSNYGIVIDAVYWKVNETMEVFEQAVSRQFSIPSTRQKRTIQELSAQFMDTVIMPHEDTVEVPPAIVEAIPQYEPFSDEEAAAFRAALASGQKPPAVHVGNKSYATDLSPLGLN